MNVLELCKVLSSETGISQRKLAELIGTSPESLNTSLHRDLYKDKTGYGMGMHIDTLLKICNAYGYDVAVQPAGSKRKSQYVMK